MRTKDAMSLLARFKVACHHEFHTSFDIDCTRFPLLFYEAYGVFCA